MYRVESNVMGKSSERARQYHIQYAQDLVKVKKVEANIEAVVLNSRSRY
jgi:hypothetical protein